MAHPFVVGGKYRNRDGEYTVIKLEDANMLIQYADGSMIETSIALQGRIWENMQLEVELEEEIPANRSVARPKATPKAKDNYGQDFHGLAEADFKPSTEGTSWRARNSLGGLLARRLSVLSGREFESHAIYRRAEVHVVQPQSFNPQLRLHEAKFFFVLNAEGVRHGFYIEKNWGEMDHTWDWLRFMASFKQHQSIWDELIEIMARHDLQWEAHVKTASQEPEPTIYVDVRAGQLALRHGQDGPIQMISWSDYGTRLERIEQTRWCDLYLVQAIKKHEAAQLGVGIGERVAEVWNLLVPLYLVTVQRTST